MNKKNLLLGGVLVILIVITYLYQGPLKEWRENLGNPKNFLRDVNVDEIEEIIIVNIGKEVVLDKTGKRLKIGGTKNFYTKDIVAKNILDSLEKAAGLKLELVSSNQDKKSEFKTDESGIQVKIYQSGKQITDFVVGKIAPDYESVYISESGLDDTYIIGVNLRNPFNQVEWKDDIIFSSDKDKINKIRFQYPNREFTIEKKEDKWNGIIPYGFSVDEKKAEKVISIMTDLRAAGIPEQTFAGTGLEKHLIIVQATGDGVDNLIMIGDSTGLAQDDNGDELYFAKHGDSDNIYLITKEQRDELDKRIWELK